MLTDQESDEIETTVGSSCQVDKGTDRNSIEETSNCGNYVGLADLAPKRSDDIVSSGDENRVLDASGVIGIEGTSAKLSYEAEKMAVKSSGEIVNICKEKVEQQSYQVSCNSSNDVVLETATLAVASQVNPLVGVTNEQVEIKGRELGSGNVSAEKSKTKAFKGEKQSCVIDVRCGVGGGGFKDSDGETVCRICHLSSEAVAETAAAASSIELILLGCRCKDELGIAHAHCAEAWFKVKGNRNCEICGETAKNVTGIGDNRFIEEWNHRRFLGSSGGSSERSAGCWRGQPFCNFLMACLVVAFVLPWFFRVNMF